MYSFYQREVGRIKKRYIELLRDIPQDVLDGLYKDGDINILDMELCGRLDEPIEESVESSRKRTFEVIEYMTLYCQRVNTVTIDSVGDDEADRLEAETMATEHKNFPSIDEYHRLYGFDPTDIDVSDVDIIEVEKESIGEILENKLSGKPKAI